MKGHGTDPGGHGGHSHHHRPSDYDWDAMADALEIDGALTLPLVEAVSVYLQLGGSDERTVTLVVDVGCGPGVFSCALALLFPGAGVPGVDSVAQLHERLRASVCAREMN